MAQGNEVFGNRGLTESRGNWAAGFTGIFGAKNSNWKNTKQDFRLRIMQWRKRVKFPNIWPQRWPTSTRLILLNMSNRKNVKVKVFLFRSLEWSWTHKCTEQVLLNYRTCGSLSNAKLLGRLQKLMVMLWYGDSSSRHILHPGGVLCRLSCAVFQFVWKLLKAPRLFETKSSFFQMEAKASVSFEETIMKTCE